MSQSPAWRIVKKLGEGGIGSVFLGVSPEGETFAVKILNEFVAENEAAFEREASLLSRLRHPGIAAIHGYLKNSSEIFGENRGPCFWMEFVDGPDVVSAARSSQDPREAALRWFVQALSALEYLHRQNVIHGDLTPQNLRVGADGALKIIDFGFASIGRTQIPADGTLLYMAPERFQGLKDESGDLFSLGTVFYEAVAGVQPREGRKSLTAMFQKPPLPLSQACPSLASDFSVEGRVIDALVSARASDRFADAGEALRALSLKGRAKERAGDAYFSRLFYGADKGLAALDLAIGAVGRKASFFAVRGPSGTGRTRFLTEVAFRGGLAGRPVVDFSEDFSRGVARMEDASSKPAVLIFRGLEKVPRVELSRLLSLHRTAAPRDLAVFEWNEDAIDPESRRLLLHSPLAARWADVVLKNLDEEQTKDFLSRGLGPAAAGEIASDLFLATRGHPRLLNDWVDFFREKGWADKSHFSKDWLVSAGAPMSLETLIRSRLQGLDDSCRAVLEVLSIDPGPAALEEWMEVLRSVSPQGGDEDFVWTAIDAMDRLKERGLVLTDADAGGHAAYRIALESFARKVRAGLEKARAEKLHEAWLQALSHAPEADARKVRHRIALKDRARFVPALEELTENLRRAERRTEALELIEESLSLSDPRADPVSHSRLLRLKTNVLNDLGRYREALACCEENKNLAAADEAPELKRAKYWMVTGLIFENLGDRAEALRRFESCLEAAASLEGREKDSYLVRSHTLIGKQLFLRGESDAAVGHFEKARALGANLARERAEASRNLAVARAREGRWPEVWDLLEEASAGYRSDGYYSGEFATTLMKGNLSLDAGDSKAATEAYARAEAVAAAHRDDLLLARVWNNQAVVARAAGDLARAWERGQRSLEIFRALGNPADLSESLKQNAMTAAEVGRFPAAERFCAELDKMASEDPRWKGKSEEARRRLSMFRDGSGLAVGVDDPTILAQRLQRIHASLPKELQVSFVDRADYRRWVLNKEN